MTASLERAIDSLPLDFISRKRTPTADVPQTQKLARRSSFLLLAPFPATAMRSSHSLDTAIWPRFRTLQHALSILDVL